MYMSNRPNRMREMEQFKREYPEIWNSISRFQVVKAFARKWGCTLRTAQEIAKVIG